MTPDSRYWPRFVGHIVIGLLIGLLLGLIVEAATDVSGWGFWGATAGAVGGLFAFIAFGPYSGDKT